MSVVDEIKNIEIEEDIYEELDKLDYNHFLYFINSSDVLFRVYQINGGYYILQEWAFQLGMFKLLKTVTKDDLLKRYKKLW